MNDLKRNTMSAIFALALSSAAWAQQQDLEVTMDVVPINAIPSATTAEIKLPETASPQAREAAKFGLETAEKARRHKGDLDREFGKEVSEAARERIRDRIPKHPPKSKRP